MRTNYYTDETEKINISQHFTQTILNMKNEWTTFNEKRHNYSLPK